MMPATTPQAYTQNAGLRSCSRWNCSATPDSWIATSCASRAEESIVVVVISWTPSW